MSADCIFCRIATHDAPAKTVFENDDVIAFRDLYPKAPTHILIVPKRHITTVADVTEEDAVLLGELIVTAKKIAAEEQLTGYKLLFNVGRDGGQVVMHVHLHLMGGWRDAAGEDA